MWIKVALAFTSGVLQHPYWYRSPAVTLMVINESEDRQSLVVSLGGARCENFAQGRDEISLMVGFAQHLQLLALQVVPVHQLLSVSRSEQTP